MLCYLQNFLNVGEKGTTAAEKSKTKQNNSKTEELSQTINYKDLLTLEWKPAIVLRWEHDYFMYLQGMKKFGY